MANRRVLLVEDDEELGLAVSKKLTNVGFEVSAAGSGGEALRAIEVRQPDIVLLDLSLPDVDGTDVCREVRRTSDIPIIMLTGRGDETDRIVGLELGADDYITKPFSLNELVARVRAVLRRLSPERAGARPTRRVLSGSGIELDTESHVVRVDGTTAALTPTEYRLLRVLMQNVGRVMSHDELLSAAWDYDQYDTHLVEVHMANLRAKVERDPKNPQRIQTVRAFGYRFVGEQR
jgi:two-component system, OmpR family, response regulator RegX3